MSDKYERQLKKGVLDMLVLKLLKDQPKYGYQIISELKEKSGAAFVLKDGTLYPILYRLEDDGLVAARWSSAEGRQVPRKYYEITEKGSTELTQIYRTWKGIEEGIDKIMEDRENE
ncbi:MAG: helix-turn-helix transcriptional regulator [Lachnospiraceae bacterium]|jgi:PadR family transcriptional regulator PadR|nr:helix-turn-helix transcriptional regulator [Lachnospiraceae bacterium]